MAKLHSASKDYPRLAFHSSTAACEIQSNCRITRTEPKMKSHMQHQEQHIVENREYHEKAKKIVKSKRKEKSKSKKSKTEKKRSRNRENIEIEFVQSPFEYRLVKNSGLISSASSDFTSSSTSGFSGSQDDSRPFSTEALICEECLVHILIL